MLRESNEIWLTNIINLNTDLAINYRMTPCGTFVTLENNKIMS